ncbi:hypothetical protein, partial [Pontibacter silvestris]|uniref:hypothetical protein n=1 Tax=Pontibacter silvestris TaxID=2305183 RepID=UPI00374CFB06|nr:hypothetical protein [Pontibacter silvestris]
VSSNGVVWATHSNPTTADNVSTPVGAGVGTFTAELTELWGSTTYYIRAYATNNGGTAYGQVVEFRTAPPVAPTVVTAAASVISGTEAEGGGEIISHGGSQISTRGLVWSTEPNFDPAGVSQSQRTAQSGYELGSFTHQLTNLTPGTTYYIRAYAESEAG